MEFHDLTLRDGCHAIGHKLSADSIKQYCTFAENAGVAVIEVGHGNGLGASSLLIGESLLTDTEMILIAKKHLKNTKLSVHVIPGIATIARDIQPAIDMGVDIFRIASHCAEASLTKTHIEYLAQKGIKVFGVLMMAALCTVETLVEEAQKMKSYGANAIIMMDSTGSFYPKDVSERIRALVTVGLPVGFHGHNNMHLAVANSLVAIENGATIIDVTMKGFGAGAGNTPLEVMASIYPGSVNLDEILRQCEKFEYASPISKPVNILTARSKLFSGFERPIIEACKKYGISLKNLVDELERRNLVAGQEDLIQVISLQLAEKS
jgi:4-hydroxy 2-oxovalerate aldolase